MASTLILLTGCGGGPIPMRSDLASQSAPPEAMNLGQFQPIPKARLGCLPFYGPFTLFSTGDPNDLGHHWYGARGDGPAEKVRGVIYTKRGGFIDLPHLRKSADLVPYAAVRMKVALTHKWPTLQIRGREPSVYHVQFHYPDFWDTLPAEKKAALIEELSLRLGAQMAQWMINWHETITWFGYKATGVLPEYNSAFTYDDTGSHALGIILGEQALRDLEHNYDDAMTLQIEKALKDLEVVTPQQCHEAIRAVDGIWWSAGAPLRRDYHIGLEDWTVRPWLVRGPAWAQGAEPETFKLATLDDVMGYDLRNFYDVEIVPHVFEASAIRKLLPGQPRTVNVKEHWPIIMAHIREYQRKRDGEMYDRPY